ncbi:MAG TPA: type II CAAX endopeptidase family protein [Kiritimatiellia bacterium]|jgi:hypothetical protein
MENSSLDTALDAHAGAIAVFYTVVVALGLVVNAVLLARMRTKPVDWRRHASRFYWRPFGDREALLLVGLLALLFTTAALCIELLRSFALRHDIDPEQLLIVVQSATFHWTALAVTIVWLKVKGIPWASAFGLRLRELPARVGQGVILLLATMPVLIFYTLLYGLVLQATGQDVAQQEVAYAISEAASPVMRGYFFFLAVVLAPLAEEILFRGVVMVALAKRLGAAAAITVTSLLFAVMHGHVPSIVPLFILSVALSLAYICTESLLVAVVMHGIFNLVSVTWLFQAI